MNPCPETVLGRTAGSREFSWPQPACFLTEPEVRSPRQSPVAVDTSSCPGQIDLKEEEQEEEMRSQDEKMSCGPVRSYDEGDETGQGEPMEEPMGDPMSQSPPQSSGRGSEEMRSQDEKMSCGPVWSYDEGDETCQGEPMGDPMSRNPPQSSGRGLEETVSKPGKRKNPEKSHQRRQASCELPKTGYTIQGVAGAQPSPGFSDICLYRYAVLP